MISRPQADAPAELRDQLDRLDDAVMRYGRALEMTTAARAAGCAVPSTRTEGGGIARARRGAWPAAPRRPPRAASTTARGRCARSSATCTRSMLELEDGRHRARGARGRRTGAGRSTRRIRPARHRRPRAAPGPGRPAARPCRAARRPATDGAAPDGHRHRGGVRVGEPPAPAPARADRLSGVLPTAASSTSHSAPGTMPAGSGSPPRMRAAARALAGAGDEEERPCRAALSAGRVSVCRAIPATTSGGSITHRSCSSSEIEPGKSDAVCPSSPMPR